MESKYPVKFPRIHPDFYLRAEWHDYRSRCFYMVTFLKAAGIPALSTVKGFSDRGKIRAWTEISESGKPIHVAINNLNKRLPNMEISHPVIMPDHIHIIVFVKEKSDLHLGEIIRELKKESTLVYRNAFPESALAKGNLSLFGEGFNDRIVYKEGQLRAFNNYLTENPRRHFLRVNYPQFFNRAEMIRINGEIYSIYGNFMLLRHPEKSFVKVSSKYSAEELEKKQKEWKETIRGAGVLVSPFISKAEKRVRDTGIEKGASIIRIVNNGFPERYKPQGIEFDLCAEGRLLLIAPTEFKTRSHDIKRSECLAMNDLAEYIAAIKGEMSLIQQRK